MSMISTRSSPKSMTPRLFRDGSLSRRSTFVSACVLSRKRLPGAWSVWVAPLTSSADEDHDHWRRSGGDVLRHSDEESERRSRYHDLRAQWAGRYFRVGRRLLGPDAGEPPRS